MDKRQSLLQHTEASEDFYLPQVIPLMSLPLMSITQEVVPEPFHFGLVSIDDKKIITITCNSNYGTLCSIPISGTPCFPGENHSQTSFDRHKKLVNVRFLENTVCPF